MTEWAMRERERENEKRKEIERIDRVDLFPNAVFLTRKLGYIKRGEGTLNHEK